ncbi:MAG: 3-dehydroquinate synthase [Candidatus Levybacteria bacterium]|nr:3-dehydroquinate synthase [Candidatus Levybacteria bacterium]
MKKTYCIKQEETTNIIIEKGVLNNITEVLKRFKHSSYLILCDSKTNEIFGNKINASLKSLSVPIYVHVIPVGEKAKNISVILKILQKMLDRKMDRKAAVIAVGGGVVGDVATLVAALYHRGIDCIQIPTTLLAQVDSALGGKGAINLGKHKNTIGTVKQPRIVLIDTEIIKSLPEKQIISGMGEIIKYAIAIDKELFEKLETTKILDDKTMDWIIKRCVKLKMEKVERDSQDKKDIRMIVNFGHTLGHAIELDSKLSHGEAIAIGMVFAIKLSKKIGLLDEKITQRMISLIKKYGLPTKISKISKSDTYLLTSQDKKAVDGIPRFILVNKIGETTINNHVEKEIIQSVLDEVVI